MYTISELPELIGTEAQVSYANDIRSGQVRTILGLLPDGTPDTTALRTFRDKVCIALQVSASLTELERIKATEGLDTAIQETINAILSAKQAANVIENSRKKGTISERVARGASKRLGWTE